MRINNIVILAISLICCFIASEAFVRYFVSYSGKHGLEQGYFSIPLAKKGFMIPPYKIDIAGIEKQIEQFKKSTNSTLIYDSDLGWTYRPSTDSSSSSFSNIHNQDGIRAASVETVYKPSPPPHHLRIAIFGDSFSHGDGVPFSRTWGDKLEKSLTSLGVKAQVLNFGVGGYGMDQAYLRYKKVGKQFSPHIVIFGFAVENMLRNLNIFRNIYKRTQRGIILSKPKFILGQNSLKIVNQPTIDPDLIPHILSNLATSDLGHHETFYSTAQYESQWWHASKMICLVYATFQKLKLITFSPQSEASQLTIQIIQKFRDEVEYNGGVFVVVHLPPKTHLPRYINEGSFKYEDMLRRLADLTNLVRPESNLVKQADESSIDSLYEDHYSPLGHEIIAEDVSHYLYNTIKVDHLISNTD